MCSDYAAGLTRRAKALSEELARRHLTQSHETTVNWYTHLMPSSHTLLRPAETAQASVSLRLDPATTTEVSSLTLLTFDGLLLSWESHHRPQLPQLYRREPVDLHYVDQHRRQAYCCALKLVPILPSSAIFLAHH